MTRRRSGGRSFLRLRHSRGAALLLAAVVALPLSAAAASAAPSSSTAAGSSGSLSPFRDTVLGPTASRRLSAEAAAFWGGPTTASTGESVNVQFSDSYPQDPAVAQHWADLLASLLHGPELKDVVLFLAPFREVQRFCGQGALACYSPQRFQIVASADQVDPEISPESIVMHEYGHHVAASSNDAPWVAIDYGTKRWSSYENVCARTRSGQLFPGAEDSNYQLNPGEAFAETYRVLNERRLGLPESPWDIVTDSLRPDDQALTLVTQDVTSPWKGNVASTATVRLTQRARARTVSVATPLDGNLQVSLRGVRNARVSFDLIGSNGARVSHTIVSGAVTRTLKTEVCGARAYGARVTLQRGSGAFRLTVSKP
jgi:hypothetical protein